MVVVEREIVVVVVGDGNNYDGINNCLDCGNNET